MKPPPAVVANARSEPETEVSPVASAFQSTVPNARSASQ